MLTLEEWAKKHGMEKDPKISHQYHFVTLYPDDIEEFWKIFNNYVHIEDVPDCDSCERIDPDNPPERYYEDGY